MPIIIFILFICLVANNYRLYKAIKDKKELSVDIDRLTFLESSLTKWNERENELLEQNTQLVLQVNELKQQLQIKPTTIIKFKKNEKNPINSDASENFTNTLSNRYLLNYE